MSSSWPCGLFWNANSSRILPSCVLTHATHRVLWTSSPTLFMGVSLTSCVGWPTATCINSSFHEWSPVRVVAESEPIHQTSRQAAQRAPRAWPAAHQFEKLARRELPRAENIHLDTSSTTHTRPRRMTYEDFKNAGFPILLNAPTAGMTWSQVRAGNLALPIKPHALWVRRLEGDIGLKRDSGSG
jgi:hypothetical protein